MNVYTHPDTSWVLFENFHGSAVRFNLDAPEITETFSPKTNLPTYYRPSNSFDVSAGGEWLLHFQDEHIYLKHLNQQTDFTIPYPSNVYNCHSGGFIHP